MKPEKIIIHHSATKDSGTVSWNAIRRFHVIECAWGDIGYHAGIEHIADAGDPAGSFEIMLGRMFDEPGAHTKGENQRSIGVCFVGSFDEAKVPAGQWAQGVKLVRWIMREFGIPADQVRGHRDFANKTCPGKLFDMELFRAELIG